MRGARGRAPLFCPAPHAPSLAGCRAGRRRSGRSDKHTATNPTKSITIKTITHNLKKNRFHVDDLSSAHVYLRLPEGATLDDIPADTLEDCCQLVKANSIQGEVMVAGGVGGAGLVKPCVCGLCVST